LSITGNYRKLTETLASGIENSRTATDGGQTDKKMDE
jgi:hypothetical protein